MGEIGGKCFKKVFGTSDLRLPEDLFSGNGVRNCSCCEGTVDEMKKRKCYDWEMTVIIEPVYYKK